MIRQVPFYIYISERRDRGYIGVIQWSSIGDGQTKIRGVIDEDIMKWEEFMLIKGDPSRIAIPTQYVGKLLGRTINGRMR